MFSYHTKINKTAMSYGDVLRGFYVKYSGLLVIGKAD